MLYQDLLQAMSADRQAKKEGRWVATPNGIGQLNGIGLASSYVAFPDPHPDILHRLLLFGNEDIQEIDAEWHCDDCGKPLLTDDKLVIMSLGVITEDGCIPACCADREDPMRPFEVYCPECAPKPPKKGCYGPDSLTEIEPILAR